MHLPKGKREKDCGASKVMGSTNIGVLAGIIFAVIVSWVAAPACAQALDLKDESRSDDSYSFAGGEALAPHVQWRGFDVGGVDFQVKERGERWSLGVGKTVAPQTGDPWFVGGGVSFFQNREFGEDESGRSLLAGYSVRPWLGGCVGCNLGDTVRLGFELQYAPPGMAELGGGSSSEGRGAVTVGFEW